MACRESCLAGETKVGVNPFSLSAADIRKSRAIFSRFSSRYPRPLSGTGLAVNQARLLTQPGQRVVEVTLSGPGAARVTDFYPYPPEDFVIDHRRIAGRDGKWIIPVEPSRAWAKLAQIGGLFIIGETGYEVVIPVRE
jgi:hypothetical protein